MVHQSGVHKRLHALQCAPMSDHVESCSMFCGHSQSMNNAYRKFYMCDVDRCCQSHACSAFSERHMKSLSSYICKYLQLLPSSDAEKLNRHYNTGCVTTFSYMHANCKVQAGLREFLRGVQWGILVL